MTNAERIARHIAKHGTQNILVHSIPGTGYWLVCEKTQKTAPHWRVHVCHPERTTYRLVSENVTDEQHISLWKELTTVQLQSACRPSEAETVLRKHATQAYKKLGFTKPTRSTKHINLIEIHHELRTSNLSSKKRNTR